MRYILGEENFIASSINPSILSESWPASLNNVRNETNLVGTGNTGRTFCKRRFASVATAKKGGGSDHCPKYLLISSQIPGSTRMFISLGLLSAPALGILQICKKNLDLGLSEHPLLSKISAPHRRIIQARTKHQLLSTNFGLFIHVMTYSFISGAYVKPQKNW